MNSDVTKCGGIWRAFQLLETPVNLQQLFDATIVTPSMTRKCRLASLVLSVLSVFVQRGGEMNGMIITQGF